MSRPRFHVTTSILLPPMLIFVATTFFWPLNKLCVATSIPCRDLAVLLSIAFYVAISNQCRDLISVVNHQFLVRAPLSGCDSNLLVCLFSCRGVGIRSRPSSFFNHCNSCRDLKSMSRPFFLPIQSQPHFSVTTVPFNFLFLVATSKLCRDMNCCPSLFFCCSC